MSVGDDEMSPSLDRQVARTYKGGGWGAPRLGLGVTTLEVTGVDKAFVGVYALRNVSFEALAGEVHGIVGENGAGKSTLMAITAGALAADAGSVRICGVAADQARPEAARDLGLAIVYQEPALVPDLSVTENVMLTLPAAKRQAVEDPDAWVDQILAPWRAPEVLRGRQFVRDLPPDARFIVEIVRALAEDPTVLVLDEPTEHLPAKDVEHLFRCCRELCARGGTVVYISHRIAEVKRVCDRITVLCDGSVRATLEADDASEADIVAAVAGRTLTSPFPAKCAERGPVRLEVTDLHGGKLDGVDLTVHAGEIVGLAGIEGQGQSELLRAIVGLEDAAGEVAADGVCLRRRTPSLTRKAAVAYVPRDRRSEGVFPGLTVRENITARVLDRCARAGVVRPAAERRLAEDSRSRLGIKTASLESQVETLSGGNQQKTVLARALVTAPAILLADEPTQGVDVGARAEIYGILRSSAESGTCIVVSSTDVSELVGLCDRVVVVSRGKVIAELGGKALDEQAVRRAILTSNAASRSTTRPRRLQALRALGSDRAPTLMLLGIIAALAAWATSSDHSYLSATNITSVTSLFAILAFVALGQQLVLLTGGMDLSVGPLIGFLVVLASFQLSEERTVLGLVTGAPYLVVAVVAVGALNFVLVRHLQINPMIATLVTYMALQGCSLLLRPQPGGSLSTDLTSAVGTRLGPVSVAALLAVALAIVMDVALRRTRWGWSLRAAGSNPDAARRSGVDLGRTLLSAYIGCAALTSLGALLLMGQVGSGDPNAGTNYTFASIAAVVLGGASIFGGRGSFVSALTGAFLVVQVNTVALFVGLDDSWRLYLLGGLTLAAAACYSRLRSAS